MISKTPELAAGSTSIFEWKRFAFGESQLSFERQYGKSYFRIGRHYYP